MASNARNSESARAVQYLNISQDHAAPAEVQRPMINVPIDTAYALQRFLNPQAHADDRVLRPTQQFRVPLTEHQSRERMTAILVAAANGAAPDRN